MELDLGYRVDVELDLRDCSGNDQREIVLRFHRIRGKGLWTRNYIHRAGGWASGARVGLHRSVRG